MAKVKIVCDRCHEEVEGLLTPIFTGGFYNVAGAWAKYGREGEEYICDHCMWSDPDYMADYGSVDAVAKQWLETQD